jgi:hypothetical protein
VLAAGALERVRGERAVGAADVPRAPDELEPEWLTATLCSSIPGARVSSARAVGAGAGTTTRAALEITYNDHGAAAGLPTQLFVKATPALAQRIMLGLGGLLRGEPGFYARIRPELEIEAPVGYHAAVDARSWRSIVVMEDVARTRGARFWQPATWIGRERIEDLLRNVASWHGALWDSPRLAACRWLKTPAEHMRVIDALIGMFDRTAAGTERARAVIPPALRRRRHDLYTAMRRSMQAASQAPHTYLHGDLHIANTYLTQAGTVGVVDWQVGLRGSWAFDYAYILATALTVEHRRAWEHDLLNFYLEHLAAAGGETIPRHIAWLAYRRATLYPYFAWVYTIGRSRLQPTFQPDDVSLAMIERISSAIVDLDSLGAVCL